MRVCLENLQPEMVLAADIVDGIGRLLLPGGTVLSDKHLRYCQMWGVTDAEIVGDQPVEDSDTVTIDPAALASAEADVRPAFRHCDLSHPVVEAVFKHCVLTRAGHRVLL
jgi:hypothetical protein